jgi:hypothetical protein
MSGPFLIFITLFWSAIVLGFDGAMANKAYKQFESGSFPSVTGTVTHSEIETRTGSKGRTYYVGAVSYEYNIGGQTYWGNRLRFGAGQPGPPDEIVNAHPARSPVQVYYNPKNPNDSLLYPGIAGSDIMQVLFLTPFNMILLGVWLGFYGWLRKKIFKPVAGGLKIITDGMTTRVRLPTLGAIPLGLATTGLLGFLSLLVLLICTSARPSIATVLVTIGIVYLAGIGVFLRQQQKINSGIDDLVINEGTRTLELPLTFGRKKRVTVGFAEIETVWVDVVEHHNSKGGTSYSYAPTLRMRDNQAGKLKLANWSNKVRANDFAEWLGNKIGVSKQPAF